MVKVKVGAGAGTGISVGLGAQEDTEVCVQIGLHSGVNIQKQSRVFKNKQQPYLNVLSSIFFLSPHRAAGYEGS